jgi:hypothetical protein
MGVSHAREMKMSRQMSEKQEISVTGSKFDWRGKGNPKSSSDAIKAIVSRGTSKSMRKPR